MEQWAVIGLGNPGPAYARTRHNVGFLCLDHYAEAKGVKFTRTAWQSRIATFDHGGRNVVLAKPRTFMNLSGGAAQALVHSLRIPVERLLVVYDDVDLPPGRVRVRPSGGAGGHNGMRSIISNLGSDHFPRVRVGIGRPGGMNARAMLDDALIEYVLGAFSQEEEAIIDEAIGRVNDVLDCIIMEGVDAAMNGFNGVV